MSGIIGYFLIILSVFIIYKFCRKTLLGPIPQSPAAMGRAFAAITFIFILTLFVTNIFHFILTKTPSLNPIFKNIDVFLYLGVVVALIAPILAGILATRTTEDTKSMNLKLIIGVGIFPYFIITSFAFMGRPIWANYIVLLLFIPNILFGFFIKNKMPNKAFKAARFN